MKHWAKCFTFIILVLRTKLLGGCFCRCSEGFPSSLQATEPSLNQVVFTLNTCLSALFHISSYSASLLEFSALEKYLPVDFTEFKYIRSCFCFQHKQSVRVSLYFLLFSNLHRTVHDIVFPLRKLLFKGRISCLLCLRALDMHACVYMCLGVHEGAEDLESENEKWAALLLFSISSPVGVYLQGCLPEFTGGSRWWMGPDPQCLRRNLEYWSILCVFTAQDSRQYFQDLSFHFSANWRMTEPWKELAL